MEQFETMSRNAGQIRPEPPEGNDYRLDVFGALGEGWSMFWQAPGKYVGYTLLLLALLLPMQLPSRFGSLDPDLEAGTAFFFMVLSLTASLLSIPLYAGFYVAAFRQLTYRQPAFGDFFRGFGYLAPLLLAALLTGLIVFAGTLLLLLPGIYFGVAYTFAPMLVVDARLGAWQALETSRKTVTRHWFTVSGLLVVLGFVNIVGVLALGIGMLVSLPVSYCAIAAAYRQVFGLRRQEW